MFCFLSMLQFYEKNEIKYCLVVMRVTHFLSLFLCLLFLELNLNYVITKNEF